MSAREVKCKSALSSPEDWIQQSLSSADTPVSKQKCPYIAGVPSSEGQNDIIFESLFLPLDPNCGHHL